MLIKNRYKAHPKSFAHIKNLLEGYDNLVIMTIIHGSAGLFELKFNHSMAEEVKDVIEGVSQEVDLVEL